MRATGVCHALFALDIGRTVDLNRAEKRLTDEARRKRFKNKRRAPQDEGRRPSPLRIEQLGESISINTHETDPHVEVVLYEIGAASIRYIIPFEADLEDLALLSYHLYDNEQLLADAKNRIAHLVTALDDAVDTPEVSELVEDYVMVEIQKLSPSAGVDVLWHDSGPTVARILRAETMPLSNYERDDALSKRTSYGTNDAVIIDWFAAILFGDDTEDERIALEFGVVELLELRLLDSRLDHAVEDAFELANKGNTLGLFKNAAEPLRRIAEMQTDGALLFEGVHNSLKLWGDQYLARMYAVASERFHLAKWEAAIDRKLQTLESIHDRLANMTANRRLEALEWIIVLLIALDIVLYFVPGLT